jgi:hypothetical protein
VQWLCNLSYSSLASYEAKQAILGLQLSDPKFYTEISFTAPADIGDQIDNDANGEEQDISDEELDNEMLVKGFQKAAMAAGSAADIAAIGQGGYMASEGELHDIGDMIEPIMTRSRQQLRASARYTGQDWMGSDSDSDWSSLFALCIVSQLKEWYKSILYGLFFYVGPLGSLGGGQGAECLTTARWSARGRGTDFKVVTLQSIGFEKKRATALPGDTQTGAQTHQILPLFLCSYTEEDFCWSG